MLLGVKNIKNLKKFKMTLQFLSLVVFITIIILILYGCKGPFENFENKPKLDHFSQEILDDAKKGVIDGGKIASYIKSDKLTKEDIDSIIQELQLPEDKKEDKK